MEGKDLLNKLVHEPYRVFFPVGVLIGLYGVGHWLLYGMGAISHYSNVVHASIQIQSFVFCFAIGFLLTAMPKFMLAPECTLGEFIYFLLVLLINVLNQLANNWLAVQFGFILGLVGLHTFIYSRKFHRQAPLPPEFVLLFFSFWIGILGAFELIAYHLGLLPPWGAVMGRQMVLYGFPLSAVMGIGGFMTPRLLGYFSAGVVPVEMNPEKKERIRKKSVLFHSAIGLLFLLSFFMEPLKWTYAGNFIRAAVVTAQILYATKIYKPLPQITVFTLLLWASLWFVVLGVCAQLLPLQFHMPGKHLIFIGGYSLMIFVVATKIIFTHAGLEEMFHKPMLPLSVMGGFLALSLFLRVCADFFPGFYFKFLVGASASWIAGVFIWMIYVFPKIFIFAPVKKGCTRASA